MFITKLAENNAFETDIKNERFMSLFSQKVEGGSLIWKSSEPYRSDEGTVINTYLGYVLAPGTSAQIGRASCRERV